MPLPRTEDHVHDDDESVDETETRARVEVSTAAAAAVASQPLKWIKRTTRFSFCAKLFVSSRSSNCSSHKRLQLNCNKRARHLPQLLLRAVRRLLLLNFQAAGCDYIALEIYENAFGAQLIEGYIYSVMKLAYNFSKRLGRWNMKCQLSFLYNQIYLFSCQYCVIFIS